MASTARRDLLRAGHIVTLVQRFSAIATFHHLSLGVTDLARAAAFYDAALAPLRPMVIGSRRSCTRRLRDRTSVTQRSRLNMVQWLVRSALCLLVATSCSWATVEKPLRPQHCPRAAPIADVVLASVSFVGAVVTFPGVTAAIVAPAAPLVPIGLLGLSILYGVSAGYGFSAQDECLHL